MTKLFEFGIESPERYVLSKATQFSLKKMKLFMLPNVIQLKLYFLQVKHSIAHAIDTFKNTDRLKASLRLETNYYFCDILVNKY